MSSNFHVVSSGFAALNFIFDPIVVAVREHRQLVSPLRLGCEPLFTGPCLCFVIAPISFMLLDVGARQAGSKREARSLTGKG